MPSSNIVHNTEYLQLTAPGTLRWFTEELPPLGAHEVLVQTHVSAISIGSELPHYRGTSRTGNPSCYPRNMGYENVGIIIACGIAVQTVHCGDRVVAFYGQRTHSDVPESQVIVVPAGISDALAILTILTCDAAKGVRKLAPRPEEPVLIAGAGAMGLLTLFILKAYGIAQIDVVEPLSARHTLARSLGARDVLYPEDTSLQGKTYSVAFECSSSNAAFALLQRHLLPHGRICITADGNIEPLVLAPDFHEKELQVVASSDGWDYHKHAAWYFHYLQQNPTSLEQLFELRISRDELIPTCAQLAQGNIRPVKVLVSYQKEDMPCPISS